MSIFSDINFDRGSENPFSLEPGTYETSISDAVIERASTGTLGLWVTFSNDEGKSVRKWVTMPEEDQDEKTYDRNVSFLKLFLKNLEIPDDQWNKVRTEDLIGLNCTITVVQQKKNPEYTQVGKITRSKGTPTRQSSGSVSFMPSQNLNVPADGGISFKY